MGGDVSFVSSGYIKKDNLYSTSLQQLEGTLQNLGLMTFDIDLEDDGLCALELAVKSMGAETDGAAGVVTVAVGVNSEDMRDGTASEFKFAVVAV
jgi:hypothetical protein